MPNLVAARADGIRAYWEERIEMKISSIVGGVLLLAVAVWAYLTGTDVTFKYLGAGVLAVLGIVMLVAGFRRGEPAS